MNTTILNINEANCELLQPAAQALKNGGLVVFPTETVYGLGAVFNNDRSLLNIFAVKGRPADNPLIVHIWDQSQLPSLTETVSTRASKLIKAFWPGPLTLIFPKKATVSPVVTAGLNTVAVRMPSHPVARELLRLTGLPVAAPSANLSGKPSPTRSSHVINDLNGKVAFIINAGSCSAGIESTVVTLEPRPVVLRPGSITVEMLEQELGETVFAADPHNTDRPQAPGMKYRHYAPQAPVILFEGDPDRIVVEINRQLAEEPPTAKVVVIGSTENMTRYQNEWVLDLGPLNQPETAAARLYDLLYFCDQIAADRIYIEGIAEQGVGAAVANRLRKAAGGYVIHVS